MASSSRPPTLTLYSLTTSPHTHPSLPLLDPHSLYLATLLLVLCPSTTFCVRPPNLWLHKSLPRLEATGTGVVLAEGPRDVERWILNKSAGSSGEGSKDGENGEEGVDSDLALSSYLDRHVEPMVYSILFPPSTAQDDSASTSSSSSTTPASFERIFTRLTFPSWSSNLPFPASRTLPHSVRSNVISTLPREWRPSTRRHAHAQKQKRGSAAGPSEEASGSPSTSSGRVPLGQPSRHAFWGFGREVKEDWSEEFEKKRLARQARKVMAPVVSWLEALRRSEVSRERERESPRSPAAVEIRLFTLLAPILVVGTGEVRDVLRGHPVARLMLEDEEYATLRDWVKTEVERAWGATAKGRGRGREWVGVRLGGAAETAAGEQEVFGDQLGNKEGVQEKAVPAPSTASSPWRTYLPAFPSSPWRKSAAADTAKPSAPSKPAEPPALRYGRYIWIGTAVLGTVGWLLASGVVSVSFEDNDEEEEGVEMGEGEDEEDEGEDREDGGGWRFARGDGEGEDQDDEDDGEMVVDLDDDDDEYDE